MNAPFLNKFHITLVMTGEITAAIRDLTVAAVGSRIDLSVAKGAILDGNLL